MSKRKIGFYWLHLQRDMDSDEFYNVGTYLPKLLEYIISLEKVCKKCEINKNKFCFADLSDFDEENECSTLLMKSATHSYRAPLIDKNTIEERENPKRIEEGEQRKTHAFIKYKENDAIVFLETGQYMLTLSNLCSYLNDFIPIYNERQMEIADRIPGKFTFSMIPRDDFREVLNNMERVTLGEVFISKSLLGSDSFNFSDSIDEVKEDVMLSIKSERRGSIKSTMYDFLNKLNGGVSRINRIRIKGKLPNNNESIIDTSFIIKKEYIDVVQNDDTGEFNSENVFSQLQDLADSY